MALAFVDLGAFNGDTLEAALRYFPACRAYYGIEPLAENFAALQRKFGDDPRVKLIQAAASVTRGEARFYLGSTHGNEGGSLRSDKTTCYRDRFETVETIDTAELLSSIPEDVILKVDIEGAEYEVLPHLARRGCLNRVKRLFCEWHAGRVAVSHEQHLAIVDELNRHGMRLTGSNKWDEFIICVDSWSTRGRTLTELGRNWILTKRRLKKLLRGTTKVAL